MFWYIQPTNETHYYILIFHTFPRFFFFRKCTRGWRCLSCPWIQQQTPTSTPSQPWSVTGRRVREIPLRTARGRANARESWVWEILRWFALFGGTAGLLKVPLCLAIAVTPYILACVFLVSWLKRYLIHNLQPLMILKRCIVQNKTSRHCITIVICLPAPMICEFKLCEIIPWLYVCGVLLNVHCIMI